MSDRWWKCLVLGWATLGMAGGARVCSPAESKVPAGVAVPAKVVKVFCYEDASGTYRAFLSESQDRFPGKEPLSSRLTATGVRIRSDSGALVAWTVEESARTDEAGGYFGTKLAEWTDLDGDGLVDPVLVVRYCRRDGQGGYEEDPFSGRMKNIVLHGPSRAQVEGISGLLDHERSLKADSAYFALPQAIRAHLVGKFRAVYESNQFGYDNSHGFRPQK